MYRAGWGVRRIRSSGREGDDPHPALPTRGEMEPAAMLRLQAARLKDLPIRGPAQEAVAQILELVEVRVADAKLALLAAA